MVNGSNKLVLLVCYDTMLAETQAALLSNRGLAVRVASDRKNALQLLAAVRFDLLVLGHSLPPGDRNAVAAACKRLQPATPVLAAHGYTVHKVAQADAWVYAQDGPQRFVEKVISLLARETAP